MMWALVLLSLAFTQLDATLADQCPQVKLIENFDLSSYAQGTWYEIARYQSGKIVEGSGNCVRTNYTKIGDDYIIEIDEVEDKKRIVHDGYLDLVSSDHLSGLVNYVFHDLSIAVNINISFLAVDYNSYAIKYFCKIDSDTGNRLEIAWILSRTKKLTDSAKAAVDDFLASSTFLDKNLFFWDEFSDSVCKFDSSDIQRQLPKRIVNIQ